MVVCTICQKHYIGRSVRRLKTRIGEHRQHYYKILRNERVNVDLDEFALGQHLYEHGFRHNGDFNETYRICILEICSPKALEVKEHYYIHKLSSLSPGGLNISNPFAIPPLYK